MKKLKKIGALALCLALLAIPLLLAAPEVSAAESVTFDPLCYTFVSNPSVLDLTYAQRVYFHSNSVLFYVGTKSVYGIHLYNNNIYYCTSATSMVSSNMLLAYSGSSQTWSDDVYRGPFLLRQSITPSDSFSSWFSANLESALRFFDVRLPDGSVVDSVYYTGEASVEVNSTGFRVYTSESDLFTYVYDGTDCFAGVRCSLVSYAPGDVFQLSSASNLFVEVDVVPTYSASFYGMSGSLISSTGTSYSPLTLQVTSSGATITLADGDPLTYTYTGTEIFAGFATSASGSATYTPGNTYILNASSTLLYAKEKARPTYAASFYGLTGSLISSTGTSYSPLTLQVTSSGATITLADGDPLTYTYTGTEIFAGFATSSSGAAVYTPGNTYTLNGAATSLYVKQTVRPTYAASIYDISGSLFGSTATSYSTLTLEVTSTGATITLADGESLTYSYTGSEIFAGFATSASGSVVYSPGETYTLSAASTNLYAKETPRPTYTVNLFDVGSSELLANAMSYEYITMKVTASGAIFSSMGETFEYTYSGTEIFAGFAISSGGTAEYVPGKTYTLSTASTSLYALETPRPVYIITLYDSSGTVVVGPLKSYSPISFRITGNVVKFVTAEDQIITWTYEGDKQFLGFALDQEAEDPTYRSGVTYSPKNYEVTLYVVDKVIDLGAAGDILDVFSALSAFFINMVVTATGVFWTADTGLTFLGALLVITSGFVSVFLITWLVLSWIKNKR